MMDPYRLTSTDHFEFSISLISLEHVFGPRDPHRKPPVGSWRLVQLLWGSSGLPEIQTSYCLVASTTLAGLLTEKMSLTIETATSSPFYKSEVRFFAAFYESEQV